MDGIEPTIWRRIQIPENYSFWDLHVAIQDSMGWQDCHLHQFQIADPVNNNQTHIGIPDDEFLDEDMPVILPGWETNISD